MRSCQSSWYHGTPQSGTRVRVQHRRDRHLAARVQLRTFALLHTSSKRVKGCFGFLSIHEAGGVHCLYWTGGGGLGVLGYLGSKGCSCAAAAWPGWWGSGGRTSLRCPLPAVARTRPHQGRAEAGRRGPWPRRGGIERNLRALKVEGQKMIAWSSSSAGRGPKILEKLGGERRQSWPHPTYLLGCSSEGTGTACSVRSRPASCWSWGWTASADGVTFPHRPGHKRHQCDRQVAKQQTRKPTASVSAAGRTYG